MLANASNLPFMRLVVLSVSTRSTMEIVVSPLICFNFMLGREGGSGWKAKAT